MSENPMQYTSLHLEEFHRIRPKRKISSICTGRQRKREFIGIRISRKKVENNVHENTIYVYAQTECKPSKQF